MSLEAPSLTVNIEKRLGSFHLRSTFAAGARELIVLFGPSGSGKSLSLRSIAGLLRPDAGQITIDGTPVFDANRKIDRPPQQRGVGMVVQSYALFPHMTVADNIAFGLRGQRSAERRNRVEELLTLLDLNGLAGRKPHAISGGQAQRVALARALAPNPRLLLLDEPFSALDTAIRVNLRREVIRLKRDLDLTIVFVTHDLREAYALADRIAVFDAGAVLQTGSRDEVFNTPASARVAHLMEVRNVWRGRVTAADACTTMIDTGPFVLRAGAGAWQIGDPIDLCIRPERILLLRPERLPEGESRDSIVTADLVEEVAHGASYTLYFRAGEGTPSDARDVEVDISSHVYDVLDVRSRRRWSLAFPREALHLMRVEGEGAG
ncbi:MAG: ABC transporter ATP-binding protein [Dehalococcoidia bacterium]